MQLAIRVNIGIYRTTIEEGIERHFFIRSKDSCHGHPKGLNV